MNQSDILAAKEAICEVGRRMYQNGFVAANDGNISVRLGENDYLCTPTGVSKGYMTPEMICRVDGAGNATEDTGAFRPSSEVKMHMRIYQDRPDVNAVVHAHPPHATAYAIAGIPLTAPIMPEAVIFLGCVPVAPYGTPSTQEVPDGVAPYLPHYDAVLLENHGALTYGADVMAAYFKMESVEFYAKLLSLTHNLGGPQLLTQEQVQKLHDLRKSMHLPGKHPMDICGRFTGKNTCNHCHK